MDGFYIFFNSSLVDETKMMFLELADPARWKMELRSPRSVSLTVFFGGPPDSTGPSLLGSSEISAETLLLQIQVTPNLKKSFNQSISKHISIYICGMQGSTNSNERCYGFLHTLNQAVSLQFLF